MGKLVLDILNFDDFRKFLRAVVESERENSHASLATLAKRFGLSQSSLHMIVGGSRSLSIAAALRIGRFLKFSREQTAYFEALVLRDQANDKEERAYHAAKLKSIRRENRIERVRISNPELFSRWYMPAILLYLLEHVAAQRALPAVVDAARELGCAPVDVEEILKILKKHGALLMGKNGRFKVQIDRVRSFVSQKRFMKELLVECGKRVDNEFECNTSFFSADALTLTSEQFLRFVGDYKALMEKYMSEESCGAPVIHQVATCAFPVRQSASKA